MLKILSTWREEQELRFSKFVHDQNLILNKLVSEIADLKVQNAAIQKTNLEIEKKHSLHQQKI